MRKLNLTVHGIRLAFKLKPDLVCFVLWFASYLPENAEWLTSGCAIIRSAKRSQYQSFLNERVMSLRVRCPQGCIMHASMIRSGKIVRCPKCKTMIRIPEISDSERNSGQPVECQAEIYEGFDGDESNPEGSLSKDASESRLPVAKPRQQHHSSETKHEIPSVSVKLTGEPLTTNRLSSPPAKRAVDERTHSKPGKVADLEAARGAIHLANRDISIVSAIKGNSSEASDKQNWEERLRRANTDRFFLAKLFAAGLILVAGLNLIPVLTQLISWGDLSQVNELPNWFFLQVAISLLNLLYAIFLFQINDWSAMRAVSVLMLVIAFIYGVCCTGLLLGGNEGSLVMFLEISSARVRQAASGFAVMLCLATLMSYWAAKEASNWQRAEQVLKQILAK